MLGRSQDSAPQNQCAHLSAPGSERCKGQGTMVTWFQPPIGHSDLPSCPQTNPLLYADIIAGCFPGVISSSRSAVFHQRVSAVPKRKMQAGLPWTSLNSHAPLHRVRRACLEHPTDNRSFHPLSASNGAPGPAVGLCPALGGAEQNWGPGPQSSGPSSASSSHGALGKSFPSLRLHRSVDRVGLNQGR